MISLVVARSSSGTIGRDGRLPWRLPSDMKHFRALTTGGVVLMGRRTYESLPDSFRPLPDRRNLVLSSDAAYEADGAEVFSDLDSALAAAGEDCFVIGGELTYREALPCARRAYVTEVEESVDGDTFFPTLAADEWQCIERGEPLCENGHSFAFCVYERTC
jgi:dihydrofolate reductase